MAESLDDLELIELRKREDLGPLEQRLLATVNQLQREQRRGRPTLLVIYPDGYVEIFGNRKVKIVQVPNVSWENEERAAEFLVGGLPLLYQELFEPTNAEKVLSLDCVPPSLLSLKDRMQAAAVCEVFTGAE